MDKNTILPDQNQNLNQNDNQQDPNDITKPNLYPNQQNQVPINTGVSQTAQPQVPFTPIPINVPDFTAQPANIPPTTPVQNTAPEPIATEPVIPPPPISVNVPEFNQEAQQGEQASSIPDPAPVQVPEGAGLPDEPKKEGFNFKKIFLIFGILVILFLAVFGGLRLFSAYQNGKNEKVTLEYWGLWEDGKIMNAIIADFQKENPNITVKYSKQDINGYRQKLVKRIENGTGPDVFRYHNSWPLEISSYLLPLSSDTISSEDFRKWFYPAAQEDLVRNGAIYGIPLEIDTLSLFINEDLFEAAGIGVPDRWEDFASISAALTVKDNDDKIKTSGVALGTANNIDHASDIISLLLAQNGVDLKNISSKQENVSQALQYYTSFALTDSKVWDQDQDSSMLAFSKGNLGMYFGYSYDVFSIQALNPNLNFKIAPVPKLAGRELTIASYWVEGVSVRSKHQKEALKLLKYLAKRETEQKLFSEGSKTRLFGEPYARVDLADSLMENVNVYPFVQQAPKAVSTYFSGSTFDQGLNDELNNYLFTAVDSILQDTSPDSAAETLIKGFDQTLAKYGKR